METRERCLPEQVQNQLARILASDPFRRSPSLCRFLSYLVNHALTGDQDSIKEYRLGLDVFDRGDDFDPRDDTIVRVQARNLRARLDAYFENATHGDTVRFVLPKGAYAIHFEPLQAPQVVADPPAPTPIPSEARKFPIALFAAAFALSAIFAGIYFARHSWRSSNIPPAEPTLLVAPFANLSSDKDNEYFAGGLTEELIDALGKLPGLRVVARASSPQWKDRALDFNNLRQLGVDNVIEGSVRKEGTTVRISVRLVKASNGMHLWSHEYDREIQDSILTEQEIASAVAATLELRFAPTGQSNLKTPNPEAYDLYLKGLYSWHQYDVASAKAGIGYLERSLSIDPSFAPSYVALAGCYGTLVIYYSIPPAEGYAKVREMSLKALELDSTLAEAHTLLAGTYAWNDWNWERAEVEYRSAVQLAPQSVIAHQYYGSFLGALGRASEAEPLMREAIRLDPLDSLVQWGEAQLMHWRGENPQAEKLLLKISAQDPDFGLTTQLLAEVYWAMGKDAEALAALRAHLAKHPADPIVLGQLGYSLARAGQVKEARDILKTLDDQSHRLFVPPQASAFVHLGLGETDLAMTDLAKALNYRTLRAPWLRIERIYTPLRLNPHWTDLLHSANLQ